MYSTHPTKDPHSAARSTPNDRISLAGLKHSITKILPLLCVALLLSGCLTDKIETRKKADALEATLYSYANAIRWAYFDQAYGFRKYDKGEYPEVPKKLKDLRVTAYDVIHPPTMMDDDIAVQLVEIEYYYVAYQRLKKLQDRQVWVFDEEAKRWYLDTPIPEFD